MNPLDNELKIILPYTLLKGDAFSDGEFCFNSNFLDILDGENYLARIPFEYVQIIYKAMCDQRFDIKEDET